MEFNSILDLRKSPYKGEARPSLYLDLNINQIVERIEALWGEKIAALYHYLPADGECEAYRREVMQDVKKGKLYEELLGFVGRMKVYQESCAGREAVTMELQKAAWQVKEVVQYGEALKRLYEALKETEITSRGFLTLREYLEQYLCGAEFQQIYEEAQSLLRERGEIRFKLTYDGSLLTLSEEEADGAYDSFLQESLPGQGKEMKSPFGEKKELTGLEQELISILHKKQPEHFKKTMTFYKSYKEYARQQLIDLAEEVVYYLAYYKFEKKMQEQGFAFTAPTVDAEQEMYATGLYDLALACVNSEEKKEVTGNDMVYHAGESFFVVTGPNQGGKTTFARSLGQLLFFTKMGLDVPAKTANVHAFPYILTHFSVEESIETGRGKLQEELVRLQPMMTNSFEGAFVIINELFTTAANYDACMMGQKVLQHFIRQRCRGIYVTHLKELTLAHESVVSMRAMLDEQGIQTHKITRREPGDEACAVGLVNKHQLTYAQLKERLS